MSFVVISCYLLLSVVICYYFDKEKYRCGSAETCTMGDNTLLVFKASSALLCRGGRDIDKI